MPPDQHQAIRAIKEGASGARGTPATRPASRAPLSPEPGKNTHERPARPRQPAGVRVTLRGGEFVVVAIFGPGDAFGELALVGTPQSRVATIAALERCETLSIDRDEFERLRASYPGVDRFLVEILSRRVDTLNTYLLEALYVPAERRVVRRLLHLCELYSGDGQPIVIPVTQETLASLAGTTRPTANQVLRRLAASGIVEVSRSQVVVLNRTGLHQRAGQL